MYKKGIFFLIIFLIGLLAVSSVSATEDVASDLISLDDSSIDDISIQSADEDFNEWISDDNPVISDENEGESGDENTNPKTFTDLNAAINGNGDSDIYLEENFTFDSNSESQFSKGINITRSVTIHGNNNTIDANNGARVFNILSNHVTLKNIVFINGKSDYGGAIHASYDASIIDCLFINNSADIEGGAAYGGSFLNCSFDENSAQRGGGAIAYSSDYLNHSIADCTFLRNSARLGGAVYIPYNCTISNSSFVNNSANVRASRGGAVYGGNVINCSFVNNFAQGKFESNDDDFGAAQGGAVFDSYAVNCSFINNSVLDGRGGAAYGGSFLNCSFVNNSARNYVYDHCDGGAIYYKGHGTVINCTFINNFAIRGDGGAINSLSAINCTFINNSVVNGSGGAIHGSAGSSSLPDFAINCTFINNSASYYGGAINWYYNESAINCSFVNNSASFDGGAIHFIDDSSLFNGNLGFVVDCSFNKNIAKGCGGAIYGGNYSNCTFINNVAKGLGNDWINEGIVEKMRVPKISASSVSVVYNNKKYLLITLKDGLGNPITGAKISAEIYYYNECITDKNGQVKILVGNIVPNNYTAKITFNTDIRYEPTYYKVKVVVKKATPKFVAAAKTFKLKVKTKKYTITLKNNMNNVLKNAKLTLKVNGKTYKAKTNTKGKATFKITKLTKKGTFKATISFAGSKYYNKISKKVKITVKK